MNQTALEVTKEQMGQELSMTQDKLIAAEQSKNLLCSQLDATTSELDEYKKKLEVQSNVANDLTDRIAQIEYEKSTHDLVI